MAQVIVEKKLLLVQKAYSVSAHEIGHFRRVFQAIDTDNSGCLDTLEVLSAFGVLEMGVDDDEVLRLMQACDTDGSGEMDLAEFVRMFMLFSEGGVRDLQLERTMSLKGPAKQSSKMSNYSDGGKEASSPHFHVLQLQAHVHEYLYFGQFACRLRGVCYLF